MPKDDVLQALRDRFGWEEYAVFGAILSISAGIGIFYGFFDKSEKTNDEFLMGSRKMNAFPVALSLFCR